MIDGIVPIVTSDTCDDTCCWLSRFLTSAAMFASMPNPPRSLSITQPTEKVSCSEAATSVIDCDDEVDSVRSTWTMPTKLEP